MPSLMHGTGISEVEIADISPHGIWVIVRNEELFLSFEEFPWFKKAAVEAICDVRLEGKDDLHWPALDIDLSLDSIRHPRKYPFMASPPASAP